MRGILAIFSLLLFAVGLFLFVWRSQADALMGLGLALAVIGAAVFVDSQIKGR